MARDRFNSNPTSVPRSLLFGVSVAQGLALLALYTAARHGVWPAPSALWSFPLWTIAITLPVVLLLSVDRDNRAAMIWPTTLLGLALVGTAAYVGWQAEPSAEVQLPVIAIGFALSTTVAVFKALMYLQQRVAGAPMDYAVLFVNSWRNFLIPALAFGLVGGVGAVLTLWAALFRVLGIDFFARVFSQAWFLFPVLSIAFGLGVVIFRDLTTVIDAVTRLLEGLIRLLLPLLVGIVLIFLLVLPFTGLAPLWATGRGTVLLLWLTALTLFCINAVYQTGRGEARYHAVVHRLIWIGVLALPIVVALAGYGLEQRIAQYGWTVERCWGMVVWATLAAFSTGYAWAAATRSVEWSTRLGRVNVVLGLAILALMLLVNSPLLDFRKISLASQVSRIDGDWKRFDFAYSRRALGRPGYLLRQRLLDKLGDNDPVLAELISRGAAAAPDPESIWARVVYRPAPFEPPADLRAEIEQSFVAEAQGSEHILIAVDADGDGADEYVWLTRRDLSLTGTLFYREGDAWARATVVAAALPAGALELDTDLREGGVDTPPPRFRNLSIGGVLLRVHE
jgi:Domain of unknown function (DUF4153)